MEIGDKVHYVEEVSGEIENDDGTKTTPRGPCRAAIVVGFPKPPEVLEGAIAVRVPETDTGYAPKHGFESNQYHLESECEGENG